MILYSFIECAEMILYSFIECAEMILYSFIEKQTHNDRKNFHINNIHLYSKARNAHSANNLSFPKLLDARATVLRKLRKENLQP